MSTDTKMIKYNFIYDAVEELYKNACGAEHVAYKNVLDLICSAQIIDATPVTTGQWEWFDEDVGTPITGYEREWGWRCSHCWKELPDNYDDPDRSPMMRFCPNCGAKMDLEE